MELKKISFCNKTCYNICSNSFKEKLLKQISDKYNFQFEEKTIRIYDETRHSNILYKNKYLMSVKSIGNTYLLYLTKIDGINSCFLIDKKILKGYSFPRIILVKYRFCDSLFIGTLFEGDLIRSDNGWKFLISDIWIFKNSDIRSKSFLKRFSLIGGVFTNMFFKDEYLEPCPIYLKNYFPYNKVGQEKILNQLNIIDYKAQGICFTSEGDYKPSFLVFLDSNNRKNKYQNKNTKHNHQQINKILQRPNNNNNKNSKNSNSSNVKETIDRDEIKISNNDCIKNDNNKNKLGNNDSNFNENETGVFHFIISKTSTPGIYQLYCQKVGKIIKHSIARIDGLSGLKFVQNIFNSDTDQPLVKCKYDNYFKKFIPFVLSDKSLPDEYTDIIYFTHEKM